ncbi:MAG TPA: MFS transporter [Ktedonosporobacter sp.]|nr:MFS transporter [Ktedonosporobacter sp.]
MAVTHAIPTVLRNRQFRLYLLATIISTVGDGMQFIGIAWLVLQLTGSAISVGWILALTSLPGVLFSPWIGVLVDRLDRRLICCGADLSRGLLIALIPLLYIVHLLPLWILYLIVFLAAIGDRFYWPGTAGLVREIVPLEDLLAANSWGNIIAQMGVLVGAGLGGILVASFNPVIGILFNALSFLLSALLTFLIRKERYGVQNTHKKATSVSQEFLAGISYLRTHPYVTGIAFLRALLFVTLYSSNVLLPAFVQRILHGRATEFGVIDAGWAIGSMAGGIFLLSIVQKIGPRRYVVPGMFLLAGSILLFLTATGVAQAVFGYILMGLFFASTGTNYNTLIQSLVPTELQGRIQSTIYMAISYIGLCTYLGAGYLGDLISLRLVYLFLASIIFLGGCLSIPIAMSAKKENV